MEKSAGAPTPSEDGCLHDFLVGLELKDPERAAQALRGLALVRPGDILAVSSEEDLREVQDGLKDAGVTLGDRLKIKGVMRRGTAEEVQPRRAPLAAEEAPSRREAAGARRAEEEERSAREVEEERMAKEAKQELLAREAEQEPVAREAEAEQELWAREAARKAEEDRLSREVAAMRGAREAQPPARGAAPAGHAEQEPPVLEAGEHDKDMERNDTGEGCPSSSVALFVRAARPAWSMAQAEAVAQKLEQAGVTSTADLESAILADGGEQLNATLREKGLKAFLPDTLARFTNHIKEQRIQERWRQRRAQEAQGYPRHAAGAAPGTAAPATDMDPEPTSSAGGDSDVRSAGVDPQVADAPEHQVPSSPRVHAAAPDAPAKEKPVATAEPPASVLEAPSTPPGSAVAPTTDPPLRCLLREAQPTWSEERLDDAVWQLHDVGVSDASELRDAIREIGDDFEALLDPLTFAPGFLASVRPRLLEELGRTPAAPAEPVSRALRSSTPEAPTPTERQVPVPDCPPPTRLMRLAPLGPEPAAGPSPASLEVDRDGGTDSPMSPAAASDSGLDASGGCKANGDSLAEPRATPTIPAGVSIAGFIQAARPNWSKAHARAARQKLEMVGVSSLAELEDSLADGGEGINAMLRTMGLKGFHADTLARFATCIKDQKIQQRWRLRRIQDARKKNDLSIEECVSLTESAQVDDPSTPMQAAVPEPCIPEGSDPTLVGPDRQHTSPEVDQSTDGPRLWDLLHSVRPNWSEDRLDDAVGELGNVGIVDVDGLEMALSDSAAGDHLEASLDPRMFGESMLVAIRAELKARSPTRHHRGSSCAAAGTPTSIAATNPGTCRAPPSTPDVAAAALEPDSAIASAGSPPAPEAGATSQAILPRRARRLSAPPDCLEGNARASRDRRAGRKSHRRTSLPPVRQACDRDEEALEEQRRLFRKQFSLFTEAEEMPTPPHSLSWDYPLSRSEKKARVRLINVVRLLSEQRELSNQLHLVETSQHANSNSFRG